MRAVSVLFQELISFFNSENFYRERFAFVIVLVAILIFPTVTPVQLFNKWKSFIKQLSLIRAHKLWTGQFRVRTYFLFIRVLCDVSVRYISTSDLR